MESSLIFANGECRTPLTDESIKLTIEKLARTFNIPENLVIAQILRWFTKQESKIGSLLQYSIDVCSDEFIGEEFYKKDQSCLHFLSVSGTKNEDVQFINYVRNHKEVFVCRRPGCSGTLFGECPIMECEECGKQHFIRIDGLTTTMCKACVSSSLNTCNCEKPCSESGPDRITTIHMA